MDNALAFVFTLVADNILYKRNIQLNIERLFLCIVKTLTNTLST